MATRNSSNLLMLLVLVTLIILVTLGIIMQSNALNQAKPATLFTLSIAQSVEQTLAILITKTPTLTPVTPTVTLTATSASPTPIPDSFYIREIIGHGQYFALGCESNAAVDLAGYYDVQIYQYNFQKELPISDNPDFGFVGDANGPWGQVPPYAYGVYPGPVADVLNKHGVDVIGGKGYTLDEMKKQLAQSKPIIVWVIGNMVGGVPAKYIDKLGNKTIVAAYQHVVILTGYDADSVRYLNNGKFHDAPYEVFLNSWEVLGNMALFHK